MGWSFGLGVVPGYHGSLAWTYMDLLTALKEWSLGLRSGPW